MSRLSAPHRQDRAALRDRLPDRRPATQQSAPSPGPRILAEGYPPPPAYGEKETGDEGFLRCDECGRAYPLWRGDDGPDAALIPRLKRDDALATLAQDLVVYQDDPESTRLDRLRYVAKVQRREAFLTETVGSAVEGPRPAPTGGAWPSPLQRAPSVALAARDDDLDAMFDRFVGLLPARGAVLDVGCGDGAWTARLAARGLRAVGVESDAAALHRAAARGGAAGQLVEARALEMPFAPASVDGVWCATAFAGVRPDRRTVFFRQVNRVLRPDGVLFLAADTAPRRLVWRRYMLARYVWRRQVVPGEFVDRAGRRRYRYRAVIDARDLHAQCRAHGFAILLLRHTGTRLLVLGRKVRGTHD